MMRAAFGPDPLDDPLVVGWDAIVRDDHALPDEVDPADMALMRRFHSMEEPVAPSPLFFQNLEQRLRHLAPTPISPRWASAPPVVPTNAEEPLASGSTWRRVFPLASANRAIPARPRSMPWHGRWVFMRGTLAALAIMLVASLLVLYQAVPKPAEPPAIPAAVVPKPALETLVQFDFSPQLWGMPDASTWTHMEFGLFELAAGRSFTTDTGWYTAVDGPLVLTVSRGELTVTPAGPAFFYSAGQPPVEIQAGTTVTVESNDSIVYSARDTGSGSNPGSEPALALYSLVGTIDDSVAMASETPVDITFVDTAYVDGFFPPLPITGTSVSVQRLRLAPFDSFVLEPRTNWRFLPAFDPEDRRGLRIADGAMDALSPDVDARPIYGSAQLRYLDPGGNNPGPHTLFNIGEETVDLYFLVVDAAPGVGTPTP